MVKRRLFAGQVVDEQLRHTEQKWYPIVEAEALYAPRLTAGLPTLLYTRKDTARVLRFEKVEGDTIADLDAV
ncbi:hypothetical protein WME75_13915 [Sorangium sp. So ce1014]